MSQVLDELDKGQDVHAVDAALKRHEAISADVHGGVSNNLEPRPSVPEGSHSFGEKLNSVTESLVLRLSEQGHMSIYSFIALHTKAY